MLPGKNREHVQEIEPELLEGLRFVYADTIGDVLAAVLTDSTGAQSPKGAPNGADREEAAEVAG